MYHMFSENMELLDSGSRIWSPVGLVMRVARGQRLQRSSDIPDEWWDLIEAYWNPIRHNRAEFELVVEYLLDNDSLVVPGTDMDEYAEYQERIMNGCQGTTALDLRIA